MNNILKSRILRLLFLPLAFFLVAGASGVPITGVVQKVIDGDTVWIVPDGSDRYVKCRLYGIDAPETAKRGKNARRGQPYGQEAVRELRQLLEGRKVVITLTGETSYGRQICIVTEGERDANLEMIRRGLAWAYRKHLVDPYREPYMEAEREARKNKRGLWGDANPQPPWAFKRDNWN